jgi:hypothetical protein
MYTIPVSDRYAGTCRDPTLWRVSLDIRDHNNKSYRRTMDIHAVTIKKSAEIIEIEKCSALHDPHSKIYLNKGGANIIMKTTNAHARKDMRRYKEAIDIWFFDPDKIKDIEELPIQYNVTLTVVCNNHSIMRKPFVFESRTQNFAADTTTPGLFKMQHTFETDGCVMIYARQDMDTQKYVIIGTTVGIGLATASERSFD